MADKRKVLSPGRIRRNTIASVAVSVLSFSAAATRDVYLDLVASEIYEISSFLVSSEQLAYLLATIGVAAGVFALGSAYGQQKLPRETERVVRELNNSHQGNSAEAPNERTYIQLLRETLGSAVDDLEGIKGKKRRKLRRKHVDPDRESFEEAANAVKPLLKALDDRIVRLRGRVEKLQSAQERGDPVADALSSSAESELLVVSVLRKQITEQASTEQLERRIHKFMDELKE